MSEARWEGRRLCPDGGCIGVLDDAGRCPVCGQIDAAAASARPAPDEGNERNERDDGNERDERERPRGADAPADSDAPPADPRDVAPPAEPATGDEWQTRQLCDDGACIGVIERGRCNTCGKAPGT